MCGRTASHLTAPALQSATRAVRFVNQQRYRPSYNIGPASNANHPPVLVRSAVDGARELRAMRWSLIPSTAQSLSEVSKLSTFNARLESLTSSAMWRPLVENRMRRCVVIVSGFFEWTTRGRADASKQPHFVRRRDGQLMMLAGLYDVFTPPAATVLDFAADDGREADDGGNEFVVSNTDPLHSFSIITMRASKEIRFLHDRMPCILQSDEEVDLWLNSEEPFHSLARILRAFPASDLEIYQVPPLVNQFSNRGPQCIMPAAEHARSSGIAAFFRRSTAAAAAAVAGAAAAVASSSPHASDTTPNIQAVVSASPVSSPGAPPLSDEVVESHVDDDKNDDRRVRSLIIVDEDDPDLRLALELSARESAPSSGGASTTSSVSSVTTKSKRKRKNDNDDDNANDDDDDDDVESKPRSAPSKAKFDFRQFVAQHSKRANDQ